jgi:5-methyltetrahydropteroyltriglutamate--homocysteine methyltransferase
MDQLNAHANARSIQSQASAPVLPERIASWSAARWSATRRYTPGCARSGLHGPLDYVQLDSPRHTHLVSEEGRTNLARVGVDVHTWLDEMIAFDNRLIDAFPEVTWAVHLCRGNHRSMWSVEGAYDSIAEKLFNDLHVDRILAEYDSPRAGSFTALRFVPANKVVVLGLVTTKQPQLEDEDQLKRRINEASGYVPLERLALSPQCGFASTMPGNLVSVDDQRAKLELVARVARHVWA